MVDKHRPKVVAIDSPRSCAPDGEATRAGERLLIGRAQTTIVPDREVNVKAHALDGCAATV